MQEFHGHVKPGGRISARGYNKMADATAHNARPRCAYGIQNSMGLVTRPPPLIAAGAGDILRGHWPFSSADGEKDIAGRGHDCTFAGNANTAFDCLQCDGAGDYANLDAHVASFRGLGAGTISCWIYPTLTNNIVFSLTHGTQPFQDGCFYISYTLAPVPKWLQIYCYGVMVAYSNVQLDYDRWHHIAYTSDVTGNALYVDGAPCTCAYTFGTAATQCFLSDATIDTPPDTMRIGEYYYNSTTHGNWCGNIADFRIYSRAFTQAEIIDIYQGTNRNYIHADEMSGTCRIFEVQSEATGDGVYNCRAQTLDATEWDDTAGDSKVDDFDTTSVEVLNLAEAKPEATYVAHLAAGDLILAFRYWDDEAGFRWFGVPFFADTNEGRMRVAWVKTTPGAGDADLDVYLDTDASAFEVSGVICHQAGNGGVDLDECIPRVLDGDPLTVYKKGGSWYCTTIFQPINHAKGLRIVGEKLEVNIDTTQMQFDAGDDDQLKTKLDECP